MTRQRHGGLASSNGNLTRSSSNGFAASSVSRLNLRNLGASFLGSSRVPLHSRPASVRRLTLERAFVFIDGWRDAKSETERFEACSRAIESETKAKDALSALPDDRLLRVDIYRAADYVLITRLVAALMSGRADLAKTLERIRERKNAYWYRNDHERTLKAWYDALEAACLLERSIRALKKPEGLGATTKQASGTSIRRIFTRSTELPGLRACIPIRWLRPRASRPTRQDRSFLPQWLPRSARPALAVLPRRRPVSRRREASERLLPGPGSTLSSRITRSCL